MTLLATVLSAESHTGKFYELNYDRHIAEASVPLFAVVDSECDDGLAGDTVISALLRARPELASARTADDLQRLLVDALHGAQKALFALRHPGGAAVTVVASSDDVLVAAHVGDCRLYVEEAAGWVRRTSDHTMREQVRAAGQSPVGFESAREQVGIVTKVVGLTPETSVDTLQLRLTAPTHILLCTRGAWMPLDPDGDAAPLPSSLAADQLADFVLGRYCEHGQRDNATLIVARLEPAH